MYVFFIIIFIFFLCFLSKFNYSMVDTSMMFFSMFFLINVQKLLVLSTVLLNEKRTKTFLLSRWPNEATFWVASMLWSKDVMHLLKV